MIRICTECRKINADGAKRCCYCGYDFIQQRRNFSKAISNGIKFSTLIIVFTSLLLAIHQGKLTILQIDLMKGQTKSLSKTQIYQFATSAIWNLKDGGDYNSFEEIIKFTDKLEYPELSIFAEAQISRILAANYNLYIMVDESSKRDVHWFPKGGQKSEGFSMNVSTDHLIGLMGSQNHWLLRADCAKLLGDVTREKIIKDIGSDDESKIKAAEDKIIKALADRIKVDPSMGTITTALKALNKRQPALAGKNIHGFEGGREKLRLLILK